MLLNDKFPPVIPPSLHGVLTTRLPIDADVEPVRALVESVRRRTQPHAKVGPEGIRSRLVGMRSWNRRQVVVVPADPSGAPVAGAEPVAWFCLEDRARGRSNLQMVLPYGLPERDALVDALFDWAEEVAGSFARHRGVDSTVLVAGVDEGDELRQGLLRPHGFELVRTWLHMERPVSPEESTTTPAPREGVRVRRVRRHDSGLPIAMDVRWVHRILEESFEDHFNSYRESFPEFVSRLHDGADTPWDHWWIAEVEQPDGSWWPGGGLVADVSPADPERGTGEGTYLEYLGVHRSARGRGIAKALLNAAIRDAAERGRTRVGLEVDADSPTGADGLYRSMGWETVSRSQTWMKTVPRRDSRLAVGAD